MAIYRFKSRETADLLMLEPHGRRLLEVLGKDPSGAGILVPEQMPAAVQALRDAIAAEEADQQRQREEAAARGQPIPQFDPISLRLRATPFMEMLQRCHQAGVEVIWGI